MVWFLIMHDLIFLFYRNLPKITFKNSPLHFDYKKSTFKKGQNVVRTVNSAMTCALNHCKVRSVCLELKMYLP